MTMADKDFTDETKTASSEPATTHDVTEGGVLGAVGGAVVGALAGGPIGAIVGAVIGGAASAAAIDVVDKHDHDYVRTVEGRDGVLDKEVPITKTERTYTNEALARQPDYETAPVAPVTAVTETKPVVDTYRTDEPTNVVADAYRTDRATDITKVDDHLVVPVVEEELEVGKRLVEDGGARIHTHVIETPVQEQITLQEETVTVDRHAVDRVASDADLNVFEERTIEVLETAEVPVVTKEARVVEEVVVGKSATEHTETVRDTVRRTDVEVEELDETVVKTQPHSTLQP